MLGILQTMIQTIAQHLVPNYFEKESIPNITDPDLLEEIQNIKRQPTAYQAIQYAMELLSHKYQSLRFKSFSRFWRIHEKDPNKLWKRTGFLHCTQQNYLLRVLLVKGNKIQDENIKLGYSLVWNVSPHQFLIVKYKGENLALDPWNYDRGAHIDAYAAGFGMKKLA